MAVEGEIIHPAPNSCQDSGADDPGAVGTPVLALHIADPLPECDDA